MNNYFAIKKLINKMIFISLIIMFGCTNIINTKTPNDTLLVQIDLVINPGNKCVELKFDNKTYYWGAVGSIPTLANPTMSFLTSVPKSADEISISIFDNKWKNVRTESKKISFGNKKIYYFLITDWIKYIKIDYRETPYEYL